jgi:transcriptional regulator with XRE-family HTH domain
LEYIRFGYKMVVDGMMHYLDMKELGALARELRKKAGLSQAEVARRIGSSQPNVSAAEKGNDTRYITVAIHIIEYIAGKKLIGPYYRVLDESEEE